MVLSQAMEGTTEVSRAAQRSWAAKVKMTGASGAGLLVPRGHSQREPMTTDQGSDCPPSLDSYACPVLLMDSGWYCGKQE